MATRKLIKSLAICAWNCHEKLLKSPGLIISSPPKRKILRSLAMHFLTHRCELLTLLIYWRYCYTISRGPRRDGNDLKSFYFESPCGQRSEWLTVTTKGREKRAEFSISGWSWTRADWVDVNSRRAAIAGLQFTNYFSPISGGQSESNELWLQVYVLNEFATCPPVKLKNRFLVYVYACSLWNRLME